MKKIAILAGVIDVLLAGLLVLALTANPSTGESTAEANLASDFVSNDDSYSSDAASEEYEVSSSVSYKSSVSTADSSSADEDEEEESTAGTSSGSTSSGSTSTGTSASSMYDGFVFPDSNTVLLTSNRISSTVTDAATSRRAINEIYARHGYLFTKQENLDYFNTYSWYRNMTKISDMTTVAKQFNSIEKANVENLQAYENSKGWN